MRKETVSVNRPWGPDFKAQAVARLGALMDTLESQAAFQFKNNLEGVLWNTVTFDNGVEYVEDQTFVGDSVTQTFRTMTATVEVVVR